MEWLDVLIIGLPVLVAVVAGFAGGCVVGRVTRRVEPEPAPPPKVIIRKRERRERGELATSVRDTLAPVIEKGNPGQSPEDTGR